MASCPTLRRRHDAGPHCWRFDTPSPRDVLEKRGEIIEVAIHPFFLDVHSPPLRVALTSLPVRAVEGPLVSLVAMLQI